MPSEHVGSRVRTMGTRRRSPGGAVPLRRLRRCSRGRIHRQDEVGRRLWRIARTDGRQRQRFGGLRGRNGRDRRLRWIRAHDGETERQREQREARRRQPLSSREPRVPPDAWRRDSHRASRTSEPGAFQTHRPTRSEITMHLRSRYARRRRRLLLRLRWRGDDARSALLCGCRAEVEIAIAQPSEAALQRGVRHGSPPARVGFRDASGLRRLLVRIERVAHGYIDEDSSAGPPREAIS